MTQRFDIKQPDRRFDRLDDDTLLWIQKRKYQTRPSISASDFLHATVRGKIIFATDEGVEIVEPMVREVIPLDKVSHIPRSVIRDLKKEDFTFSTDQAFRRVVSQCIVRGRGKSWMSGDVCKSLGRLHIRNIAHSIEIYRHDALVGGLVGLQLGLVFSGFSVYGGVNNAGKAALAVLETLQRQMGGKAIDCLSPSEISRTFGGGIIPQPVFCQLLDKAMEQHPPFPVVAKSLPVSPFIRGHSPA